MRTPNIPCLVCKLACYKNQSLVCCTTCKLYAHVDCSKVGMNFGHHNFVCAGCHQKKALISDLVKSTITSMNNEDHTLYRNVEDMSKIQDKNP